MKIYPRDTFNIDTPLTASEMFSTLESEVEAPKRFRWRTSNGKKYQGEFTQTDFKIWRIIGYRNSFLPIVEGAITPTTSGSRIAVTMRLHRFVAAFILFWLGGVSVGLVTFSIASIRGNMECLPGLLIPLGMLLFGILLTSRSFWWEARRTKPFLIELFKGIEQQPTRTLTR